MTAEGVQMTDMRNDPGGHERRAEFDAMDIDGNGTICVQELTAFMKKRFPHHQYTTKEMKYIMCGPPRPPPELPPLRELAV